jgi:hypothetical protein
MNSLVPTARRPELGSATLPRGAPPRAVRTQARVASEVKGLFGGPGARRIFAAQVTNLGRQTWNAGHPTHGLRCRLFSFTQDFLQELPARRLPLLSAGESARVAMDVVVPLTPGRYALSLDVLAPDPEEPSSPLFVSLDVLPEREPAWNPRGLVDAAFRTFSGQAAEERALDWWTRRLADGIPIEAFFSSFEDVAGERYRERRAVLVERLGSFAPLAQNAQAILD